MTPAIDRDGSLESDSRQAVGAPEIEVTSAMVEAGARLVAEYCGDANDWLAEDRARSIFLAMAGARGPRAQPRG
jgi:hypothetical protein